MKASIITVCYNSERFLEDAIQSVDAQDYPSIEHIIVDGNSSDGTLEIIKKHSDKISHWISEPDSGIYDAMNKGVKIATGEIVGILNSDDIYADDKIISTIVKQFEKDIDAVFGDVFFVSPNDLERPVRHYSAKHWSPGKFTWGFMPPHPSFFVRKEYYDRLGLYKTDYERASDYELLIRFLKVNQLNYK